MSTPAHMTLHVAVETRIKPNNFSDRNNGDDTEPVFHSASSPQGVSTQHQERVCQDGTGTQLLLYHQHRGEDNMYQPDCQGVRTLSMVKTLLFPGIRVGLTSRW